MREMEEAKVVLDVIIYSACEKGGQWPEALSLGNGGSEHGGSGHCARARGRRRLETPSLLRATCWKGRQRLEALSLLRGAARAKGRRRLEAPSLLTGGACGKGRQRLEALSLLREIVDSARSGQRPLPEALSLLS